MSPGSSTVVELTLEAIVAGAVDSFEQEAYKTKLAVALAITTAEISLDVTAASVRVVATIRPTTRPWAAVVGSANGLVLQLTTAGEGTPSLSEVLGVTIESLTKPTTAFVIVPAPSPPPPQSPPARPPDAPPPGPSPPPPPPYYLEWLEAGSNSLMVVSITTIVYVIMISVALPYTEVKDLTLYKRVQFVFTVSLATEDFISDVLYYYVQVSPCMFESLSLSFECTTFATPALFYLSTLALFLPIAFYGIYSGLLRGLRCALLKLSAFFLERVLAAIIWLWASGSDADKHPEWPRDYSGLNTHFGKSSACLILLWIVARSLLLLLTAIAIALGLGLVPTLSGLWLAAVVAMLFFGVNTKLFALQGYLNAYNKLLFSDDDLTKQQQVLAVNFSLLAEVLFESIPQFCIVFINEIYKHKSQASATETAPTKAGAGYVVDFLNTTVTTGDADSLAERIRSFSGLAFFTLAMSFMMIVNELIPFMYRVCKAGSVVNGFHIPVLELCGRDVDDVKEFRDAVSMKEGRDVARKIKERYVARRRSASGKHWVQTSPDEGEGEGGGTGPELEARSKDSQDGRQGLRGISSCRSSCYRVTPSSAPLPPISAVAGFKRPSSATTSAGQ